MSWQRIRGHDALIQSFAHVAARGRLAHAYLFVGPPGVGKRLFAVELAKTLLCEARGDAFAACDHCSACHLVDAGTHADLTYADRPADKHEWPIERMREVLHSFTLKTARGGPKVAILDDADDFNEESANCFLKTLEEPPPRSLIVLVGTSPERQLTTILSRCQLVRFAPLSEPLVAELLRGNGVDEAAARRLARLSGGSPGQAQALADPTLWEFRRRFLAGLTATPADTVALGKAFLEFAEEAGKESAAQRGRATLVLRLLVEFLSDALRVQLGGLPRLDEPDERRALEAIAGRVDVERLLEALERCLEGDMHIDRRVQLALALEALTDAVGQKLKA